MPFTPASRRLICALFAALIVIACGNSQEAREAATAAAPPAAVEQRLPNINHVSPARDSVGPAPKRFEWTAAAGADQYAIGIWNEVDVLMWRSDHVSSTSVALPGDVVLDFGTYYWSVTALRERRPIAESGLSAFVVSK